MIHEIRTCDICEGQIHRGEYYTVKIRSDIFLNRSHYDKLFGDRKRIDICESCRHKFFMFVRNMKEPRAEVIQCKHCKWYGEPGCAISIVDDSDRPNGNDFCSFAEPVEEDKK